MILRSRIVVTMNGTPIENGAVAIEGERIVGVGPFSEVGSNAAEVIDLGEQILLPGLINAHCHLDYTCLRGAIRRQPSFTDWIRAINERKRSLTPEQYIASIEEGFDEALAFGTTTVVNYTAFPELIPHVVARLRTWWCAELIDVRPEMNTEAIVESARDYLANTEHQAIAAHAPYTASSEIFQAAQRAGLRTTHVAESFEELQMFLHASGALYDFLKEIGRDMSDCAGVTPFARAVQLCGGGNDWLFAHANELTPEDWPLVERIQRLHVVHCPRSHAYFRHAPFQFERLRDLGVNVCLGTDSLASAPDLSLFAEMREFRRVHPHVSAQATLEMVTVNAAAALASPEIGRLTREAIADLIALPFTGATADAYEAIVANEEPVRWIMQEGRILNSAL